MNRNQRIGLVIAAVAVAVVAFVLLRGGDDNNDSPTTEARQTTTQQERTTTSGGGQTTDPVATTEQPTQVPYTVINVRDGQPVGGVKKITVEKGDVVRLELRSNMDDTIHVHGFDDEYDVKAGEPRRVRFTADIDGVFDIESHTTDTQVAELTVEP